MNLPSGLAIERNVSLKPLTSWLVGGPAEFLAQPRTLDDLRESVAWGWLTGLPITILGGGTNVLVADSGVRGLTIALRKFAEAKVSNRTEADGSALFVLECLAGTSKSELLKQFLKAKLEPALFLAGLPGDVGGGVVMNAGVGEMIRPREFTEITEWIEVLRLPSVPKGSVSPDAVSSDDVKALSQRLVLERLGHDSLQWSYRHCEGWRPGIVARVGLCWPLEPKDDILARVKQANQVRLSKQPLDMPSCGSVFVNPEGHKSGQLIESVGLKGFSVGGAKVSEKHANFIVNFNDSTALDIHQVIETVRETVKSKTGVSLRTEVVYLGDW